MSRLIPLEEFNRVRRKTEGWNLRNEPQYNGIACPECGSELIDSCPGMQLTSFPPKMNVHCSKCEYKGYRVA